MEVAGVILRSSLPRKSLLWMIVRTHTRDDSRCVSFPERRHVFDV